MIRSLQKWQARRDSNPNKESQNLLCYRYTTSLRELLRTQMKTGLMNLVK